MTDTPTPKHEEIEIEREVKRQLAGIPDAAELVKEALAFAGDSQPVAAAISAVGAALVYALARQTAAIESLVEAVRESKGATRMPFCGTPFDVGAGQGFICCLPPGHEGNHA